MRILYLCHRIPYPPNKGDKIRAFHQLRALAGKHEVDLFTLADDPGDLDYRHGLAEFCRSVTVYPIRPKWARVRALPFLLSGRPLTIPYFFSAKLQAAVRKALLERSYERLFVFCSAMAQYAAGVQIPVVLDLVDVDSDKWLQYAAFTRFPYSMVYRREGAALGRYEQKACERAACVVVTTERERELALRIAPHAQVHVIANGVDTDYFAPRDCKKAEGQTVAFIGDMSYFPNQEAVSWFAREVLPLIQDRAPEARFLIVGRNPNHKVRELQRIPGVKVTGFVPDVRTHLSQTQVVVAPFSIAAGIPNKILEAMAFGLPVAATSRAVQGLIPAVARAVAIADTAEGLAEVVLGLLRDPERAAQSGMEGRRRVAEHYQWEGSMQSLLKLVECPKSGVNEAARIPA